MMNASEKGENASIMTNVRAPGDRALSTTTNKFPCPLCERG